MERSQEKHGVAVCGAGARLDARDCLFQNHSQNGVFACSDAQVLLRGCHSERSGVNCFRAESNARIMLGRLHEKECTWDQATGYTGYSGGVVAVEPVRAVSEQAQFPLV